MTLSKLLVIALIVVGIWYGYKWLNRVASAKRDGGRRRSGAPQASDLTACPACGTYVPDRLKECPNGRADCPSITG